MDAVGGLGDAHGLEVGAAEGGQFFVGEVLHCGEVFWLVFCDWLISDPFDASEQASRLLMMMDRRMGVGVLYLGRCASGGEAVS